MPLFVGIAGPSGAGKTTLARALDDALDSPASIVPLDHYYVDLADMPEEERAAVNFDHPDAFDWELFFEHLMLLQSGVPIDMPVYDFTTHTRAPEVHPIQAHPVVIIEGLFVLWQPALRAMLDYKIYIDLSQSECLRRRIERDTTERGRRQADIIRQFKTQTAPMYLKFIKPTIAEAELVLQGDADITDTATDLAHRLG